MVLGTSGPALRQAHALLEGAAAADLPRVLCELLEACARIGLGPGGGEGGACTASIRVLATLCAPLPSVRGCGCGCVYVGGCLWVGGCGWMRAGHAVCAPALGKCVLSACGCVAACV